MLKNTTRFNGLDHLRTLAILLVFFSHYRMQIFGQPVWVRDAGKFGWTGVDLFFVLSGFLIASQLFMQIRDKGTFSYGAFFIKRSFRIIPAYLVVLIIYFCVPAFQEREALQPFWKYCTFTLNFGLDIREAGTFSHAWSLCVEEHFYLVLPFLLLASLAVGAFKKTWWLLPLLFAAGFFLRYYSWMHFYYPHMELPGSWSDWYEHVYYPTWNRLDGLLLGVGIAAVYCFLPAIWKRITALGNLFVVAGLGLLTGAYFLCYEEHTFEASVYGFPLVSLGYAFLVLGALSPSCFLYKWNSKVTSFIAAISYAVYLTHKGVINVVQDTFSAYGVDVESNFVLLISFVACVAAAFVLRWSVEKPFLKWRDRLLS
jgi:peptidoglycan/LPS O-acetylase OafA/YrhL